MNRHETSHKTWYLVNHLYLPIATSSHVAHPTSFDGGLSISWFVGRMPVGIWVIDILWVLRSLLWRQFTTYARNATCISCSKFTYLCIYCTTFVSSLVYPHSTQAAPPPLRLYTPTKSTRYNIYVPTLANLPRTSSQSCLRSCTQSYSREWLISRYRDSNCRHYKTRGNSNVRIV